ncbi:MAG: TlpA disulfide reductase family protein [Candidatus Neomarinimicrobiota bacterium]
MTITEIGTVRIFADRFIPDRIIGYSTLLALLLFAGCRQVPVTSALQKVNSHAINRIVAGHHGKQAVLINFWATWCQPCVEEFPMIVALSREYTAAGLTTYFISVDFPEAWSAVEKFLQEQGVPETTFIKAVGSDNDFINGINRDWSGAVPFTIVYGRRSGDIVDLWEGEADRQRFVAAIDKALQN